MNTGYIFQKIKNTIKMYYNFIVFPDGKKQLIILSIKIKK